MNFRRILSKSSLSSSTAKSINYTEEIAKLQSEIELQKQTIDSLKISVETRDAAIGTLAREKEKIYLELKSVQRINRNLHQQLVDERDFYSKEKEYLIEEMKRLTKRDEHESTLQGLGSSRSWHEELKSRDQIIYNICSKYLKIKCSKVHMQKKLEMLQIKSQKACEDIILLLQENRNTLDNLLNKLLNIHSMATSTKKYLQLLKVNANLHFENTQLKVCLSSGRGMSHAGSIDIIRDDIDINMPAKFSKSDGKFKSSNHRKLIYRELAKRHKPGYIFHYTKNLFSLRNIPQDGLYKSNSDPCLSFF